MYHPPFYVYHNWVHGYAMIHFSDCPHCNEGRGTQSNARGVAGEWMPGLYEAFGQARRAAQATGREVRICGHCQPN